MNYVIGLVHIESLWLWHWSAESEDLKFDSSCPTLVTRGKIIFSLS